MRDLPRLQYLWIHTLAAQDRDYTPLLDLPNLTELRVMKVRGMRPSHADLARVHPSLRC
ncbi:hypothetical protein Kisp01_37560 [Kineosporia sp. NBRC 101677]|nr:hypothetical protein Kisp01_37560 [Kineosporia sp. NBRC 101677]